MEINMIHDIAWKFFRQNPDLNYDDLFAEAALAYCEAQNRFDPTRGAKETTMAYAYMKNALIAFVNTANETRGHLPLNEHGYLNNQGKENGELREPQVAVPFLPPISELLQEMTEEAKEICQMILDAPEQYAGFLPKDCRGKIYRKLRERGWTWPKIWKGFAEIKQILNEN